MVRKRILLVALLVALGASLGCGSGNGKAPSGAASATPRPTFTDVPPPTNTPPATATPTETATPPPTATPEPSATPVPPTKVPPTKIPPTRVSPTNTPAPQVGPHGVLGRLRLRDNRTGYAVNERVFFVFEAENRTSSDIPFGILGFKASNGDFHTSWTSDVYSHKIPANGVFSKDDNMSFGAPGTYTVKLAICFSPYGDCLGANAEWEEFSPGVVVTIR